MRALNARYFLIADPVTGVIVRRAHEPAGVRELGLRSLVVDKREWAQYRAGDMVQSVDIVDPWQREAWLGERSRRIKEIEMGPRESTR